jgi:protein-tyrosine phosphatase
MIMSSQLPIGAVALDVIDIHSHILPGIDDGPETLEDAVAMAKIAAASTASLDVCAPF